MAELIWDFIWDQIKSNNFLSGGAVLMVIGGLAAYFRQMPGTVARWIKRRFVIEVEVSDRDPAFQWIAQWLAAQPYSQKRARRLTISTVGGNDGMLRNAGEPATKPRIILTPAPGRHYFMFRGRLMSLYRDRNDGGDKKSKDSLFTRETFNLSVLTRRRGVIHELLEEARLIANPPGDNRCAIWTYHVHRGWQQAMKRRPRPIESVILAKGVMESLVGDAEKFRGEEQLYIDLGIPYRRTYLLHGAPGSGKSSAVWAVTSHLQMDLAIISLSNRYMGDDELRECLATLPQNCIGLIEDIDCIFRERDKNEDDGSTVTFSGLLNALDGVAATEGRIMFITTNHRDRLDPALLRPGRCDVHYELANADSSQVCRLFDRFFPNAPLANAYAFVDAVPPGKVSMAALQGHLTKHRHDIEAAVKNAGQLCTN